MKKKYIVRLKVVERETCNEVIRKLKGTSQKVRRAQILLKADVEDPAGPTSESPRPFAAERRRSKTFGNGWLSVDLNERRSARSLR